MDDMERVTIEIPDIPPSNNRYIGRGSKKEQIVDYQDKKAEWAWLVKAAVRKRPKAPFERATVHITYHFKDARRRDPDNYSGKFLLDGLVNEGIIKDDSFECINLRLKGIQKCKSKSTIIEVIRES